MNDKSMTVGDVKRAIKDIPDDMPVYIDNEHEYMALLSIMERYVSFFDHDSEDDENDFEVNCLVLGIT